MKKVISFCVISIMTVACETGTAAGTTVREPGVLRKNLF